jgi:hypothetical protein
MIVAATAENVTQSAMALIGVREDANARSAYQRPLDVAEWTWRAKWRFV